jgi:hypothetical protein
MPAPFTGLTISALNVRLHMLDETRPWHCVRMPSSVSLDGRAVVDAEGSCFCLRENHIWPNWVINSRVSGSGTAHRLVMDGYRHQHSAPPIGAAQVEGPHDRRRSAGGFSLALLSFARSSSCKATIQAMGSSVPHQHPTRYRRWGTRPPDSRLFGDPRYNETSP